MKEDRWLDKMSYQLPKSFKCCLTCAFWCGVRKLVNQEYYAETDSNTTKGMCANSKGMYHLDMSAMATCNYHQTLPALKD